MEKESKMLKFQDLLIYYFACGFIGWMMEIFYGYMVFGKFVDRGFLYGPLCPIYGCGAVLIVLIAESINKKEVNFAWKFITITVIFTVLEYIASLILELIFHQRWWDYTNEILNLNGRVCLMFSLLFGVMGVAFIEYIYTPSRKIINIIREKLSKKETWIILSIISTIYIADTICSIIKYV